MQIITLESLIENTDGFEPDESATFEDVNFDIANFVLESASDILDISTFESAICVAEEIQMEGFKDKVKHFFAEMWKRILEFFGWVKSFIFGAFKKIAGLFKKTPKETVQQAADVVIKAIESSPDGDFKSPEFSENLVEAVHDVRKSCGIPEEGIVPETVDDGSSNAPETPVDNGHATESQTDDGRATEKPIDDGLGHAAEKIGGAKAIAKRNPYIAKVLALPDSSVAKMVTKSANPETDGTQEKKDWIAEYRKSRKLLDEKILKVGKRVCVDLTSHVGDRNVPISQAVENRFQNVGNDEIKVLEGAIEDYQKPRQKVEGLRDAKKEFVAMCEQVKKLGFDKCNEWERRCLEDLENWQKPLDEFVTLFDDYADTYITSDRNIGYHGNEQIEERLDDQSAMNFRLDLLKRKGQICLKYYNLAIGSVKTLNDAKVGIAMMICKFAQPMAA